MLRCELQLVALCGIVPRGCEVREAEGRRGRVEEDGEERDGEGGEADGMWR